jgi:predicted component of type VI protein secretion system
MASSSPSAIPPAAGLAHSGRLCHPVAQILGLVQHRLERQAHQRRDDRQHGDQQVVPGVVQFDAGREARTGTACCPGTGWR